MNNSNNNKSKISDCTSTKVHGATEDERQSRETPKNRLFKS